MREKQVKVAEVEHAVFQELKSPLDVAVLVHVELSYEFDDTLDVEAVAEYFVGRGWAQDRAAIEDSLRRLADAELLEWLVLPADL